MINYFCDWCGEFVPPSRSEGDPDWDTAYDSFARRTVQVHWECGKAYRNALSGLLNGKQPRPRRESDDHDVRE